MRDRVLDVLASLWTRHPKSSALATTTPRPKGGKDIQDTTADAHTLTSGYPLAYRNPYPDLWVFTPGEEPDEQEQEHQRRTSRHPGRADPDRALGRTAPRLRHLPLARRPERQGAAGRGGDPLPRAVPPRAAGMDRGGMGHLRARPARPLLPADAGGNAAARGRGPDLRRVRGRGVAIPAAAVRRRGRARMTAQESRLRRLLRGGRGDAGRDRLARHPAAGAPGDPHRSDAGHPGRVIPGGGAAGRSRLSFSSI